MGVNITSETTKDCTALGWMTPAQARSEHPYMYTKCQAIHARWVFPCQDTPDVKSTFEFNIKSSLPVLASGLSTGVQDVHSGSEVAAGTKLYSFEQKLPIPSYLFTPASGDIEKAPIRPRSTVTTGPKQFQAAKWELEESTKKFIETIETISVGAVQCLDPTSKLPIWRHGKSHIHLRHSNSDIWRS